MFAHGSIQEFPGPAPDLGPGLELLLTAITRRTTYTSPEMPPNSIPTRLIHVWCRLLSSHAPISQPIKADDGSRMAICTIFSASARLASPLPNLGRGLDSGMGRLKGMEASPQHTGLRIRGAAGSGFTKGNRTENCCLPRAIAWKDFVDRAGSFSRPADQILHFFPEESGENSPGWSPPRRTQSGECATTESVRPVGAERATIVPSWEVHAIALAGILPFWAFVPTSEGNIRVRFGI